MTKYFSFILFVFVSLLMACSSFKKIPQPKEDNLKIDLGVLAADSLGGREAGSIFEIKARDFIVSEFKNIGLLPFFGNSFYQVFDFKDGANFNSSSITINGKSFLPNSSFYPLSKSKNDSISAKIVKVGYGIMSSKPSHNDYLNHAILDGKIFIMEVSVPGGMANYSSFSEYADIDKKIELATKFGAKAVIFVNNDSSFNDPRKLISNKNGKTSIPIIFAKDDLQTYLNSIDEAEVTLKVEIQKIDKQAYNIAGFIDNGSAKNIVIGAHYDHLGLGGETSRCNCGPAIHNGADDNASGVASIMEIARELKSKPLKYNILFIAFSGEEKGLLGSSALMNSKILTKTNVLCMLNFDMVGRLDSLTNELYIYGSASANEWDSILPKGNANLKISKNPSGIAGSDQMSFYLDSIPVLFFFTGIHDDYHKPSDDANKINYDGLSKIINYSLQLINSIDSSKLISFHAANIKSGESKNYRSGPTLGIVPDYGSAEDGLIVKAVVDDKPGSKAGILKGDFITKIGEKDVKDIYDYMDALKECKLDTKCNILVKRNGKIVQLIVNF